MTTNPTSRNLRTLALVGLTAVLSACGGAAPSGTTNPGNGGNGGNGSDGTGSTYAKFGYVTLMETTLVGGATPATGVGGSASFGTLGTPIAAPANGNIYAGLSGTCTVTRPSDSGTGGTDPKPSTSKSLDAGDPLTVTTNGATYTTLQKTAAGENIAYTTPSNPAPANPLPATAFTVNVPGATGGVPAMTLTLPATPAFTLTQPADQAVTANTTFTWSNATNASGTVVTLIGSNTHPDESKVVTFFCVAPDTGTFTFPAAAKQALADKGFTSGRLSSAGRVAAAATVKNDVLVYTTVSRTAMYLDLGEESEE